MISVVVCTYNRAHLLADVLQSLCAQRLSADTYEIIIIDNNSQDDTQLIAQKYCQQYPNIRYYVERRVGLSFARNRGWQEATGEYVAYTDDDCKVPEQWLAIAQEIIDQKNPQVFGGPYYAFYHSPKPLWWKDSYRSCEHAEKARELTQKEYLSGGNIFFQRTILESLKGFEPNFGMSGNNIGYGEETILLRRIRKRINNACIYYEPRLYVYHLVHACKMTLRWHMMKQFTAGRYHLRVFQSHLVLSVGYRALVQQSVVTVLKTFLSMSAGFLTHDRKQYPYWQNYFYECVGQHFKALGILYEKWRKKL